jgi:hypothetical protein
MKLGDNGTIVIESRYEIDDLQAMIDLLIQSGKAGKDTYMSKDELARLRDQLDVLYMSW